MIKCNRGSVEVCGKRIELQTEFLVLAKAMVEEKVFESGDDLLKSVSFAVADDKTQIDMFNALLDECIEVLEKKRK